MKTASSDSALPAAADPSFPRVPWRRSPLLLLAYAVAIVVLTWPWLAAPATQVIDHWDPPFHAWKLAFAARTLLSGHLLPVWGNTNLYYPHSGAFFYEALHWPQAVFAAPLLALGIPEVAVYHITLVFFWALSGVVFWAWLRALGLRDPFAAAGGFFFTVIPYRMSYAVEFNMQLAFGLPLLLFAIVRFFQRPSVRYACLAAAAWWLQATSELYQAVFALFAFPLFVLPLLVRDLSILKSFRRFWLPLLSAAVLGAALSVPFLLPYAKTLGDGTLVRSLAEMRNHSLEPFSYLLPWGRLRLFPAPTANPDEMSVFPTLSLAALAAWGLFAHRSGRGLRRPSTVAFLAVSSLAAIALVLFHNVRGTGNLFAETASWLLLATMVAALPWLCRRDRSPVRAAAAGLAAAALFGFAMSFGPRLADPATNAFASNRLFMLLDTATSALSGFRVISRFSVFPMLALCTAGAFGLQTAARALSNRHRLLRAAAAVLFFAVFLGECIPAGAPPMRPVRDVSSSAAIAAFDALPGPAVLAIVPMGDRSLDSEHMLTIERNDRLGIWAWGGTYPRLTREIQAALSGRTPDAEKAASLLREIWPDAYVLEDRRPFCRLSLPHAEKFFGPLAEIVAEDPEFALFRILPDPDPAPEAIRLVRADFVAELPRAVFSLSAPAPARVWLDFNGIPLASFDATPEPAAFSVDIPAALLLHHLPQRYRFHAEADAPFTLAGFRLEALPADAPPPAAPSSTLPDLPWLLTSADLPGGATPLDVRYPGGITLRGVGFRPPDDRRVVPLRFYFHFEKTGEAFPDLVLAPGIARNGSIVYRHAAAFGAGTDPLEFPFADGRIVAVDVNLPVLRDIDAGTPCELTFALQKSSGRLIPGRAPDGSKVIDLFLPVPFTAP